MKMSFQWLKDYIDVADYHDKMDELSKLLTQAGLEVEDIEDPARHWGKVVVGKLVKVEKHPDADRLTQCQVDIGGQDLQQIVCGAENHKQGDFVAAALPGAVLPGDFKIKKSKIRGVASAGMLCSVSELGLNPDSFPGSSDGILILSDRVKPGTPFVDYCENSDVVFELNVTPNRADCLSHRGLARELSTLLDRPITKNQPKLEEIGEDISQQIKVELKAAKECPRYCGRMIRGVKVGPSPDWLKSRLQSVGVNSINNIVDVTNYVLFEYGQPLHAFDYDQLKNHTITIEKATEGEKFVTLDGSEIELDAQDLLIRDGERAVALAGVVGGQNSGVTEATKDIFLESAFFAAEGVRKTSRHHGIETDACYRFSRGVDPEQTLNAMNRACELICQVAGGQVQKGHVDLYPEPLVFNDIHTSAKYISQRLGYEVSDSDFESWMKRLGCIVAKKDGGFRVTPPTYRWDLHRPEDLVEEYGRLHGYEKIAEKLPVLQTEPSRHVSDYTHRNRVRDELTGLGCYQAVNYAFIGEGQSLQFWGSSEFAKKSGIVIGEQPVKLANPLSEEFKVMRESLLPGLLKNVIHNDHHGVHYGRLFEIGEGHFRDGEAYREQGRLALAFWGEPEGLWHEKEKSFVVYSLKATIEGLLRKLGGKSWRWQKLAPADVPPGFHSGQSAQLFYEGKVIGLFGSLHPEIQSGHKIRSLVAWAELDFDQLMSRQPRSPKFRQVPKFPSVERDISLLVGKGIDAEEVGSQIKKSAGPLLENYRVFDIYEDKELEAAGRRSISFRLHFQSEKETLTDEVINPLRDKIVNDVCQKLDVESR